MLRDFPFYEDFWRDHIVPLTFRPRDRQIIYVRSGPPEELLTLASAHYSVFIRLAFAYKTLLANTDLAKPDGVYHFYMDLDGAFDDMLSRFLRATQKVLAKYDKTVPSKFEERLNSWNNQPFKDYDGLRVEISNYRNLVHYPLIVMISGQLPRPELLNKEQYKEKHTNLSLLVKLKLEKEQTANDFIDAKELAGGHFNSCLKVLNNIWQNIINEFDEIRNNPAYQTDQATMSETDKKFLRRQETIDLVAQSLTFNSPSASGMSIETDNDMLKRILDRRIGITGVKKIP